MCSWLARPLHDDDSARALRSDYCGKRPGYENTVLHETLANQRCGISLDAWFNRNICRTPKELSLRRMPGAELYVVSGHEIDSATPVETFVVAFSRSSSSQLRFDDPWDALRLALGTIALAALALGLVKSRRDATAPSTRLASRQQPEPERRRCSRRR